MFKENRVIYEGPELSTTEIVVGIAKALGGSAIESTKKALAPVGEFIDGLDDGVNEFIIDNFSPPAYVLPEVKAAYAAEPALIQVVAHKYCMQQHWLYLKYKMLYRSYHVKESYLGGVIDNISADEDSIDDEIDDVQETTDDNEEKVAEAYASAPLLVTEEDAAEANEAAQEFLPAGFRMGSATSTGDENKLVYVDDSNTGKLVSTVKTEITTLKTAKADLEKKKGKVTLEEDTLEIIKLARPETYKAINTSNATTLILPRKEALEHVRSAFDAIQMKRNLYGSLRSRAKRYVDHYADINNNVKPDSWDKNFEKLKP